MTAVAIIGLGVIGGSLARALAAHGTDVRVYAPSRAERDSARADGLRVHDHLDAAFAAEVGAVVIAVPLDRIGTVAREVKPFLSSKCVLMHAGSLQQPGVLGLADSDGAWLVGSHPLAGSEGSGYKAARLDLFADATVSADVKATAEQRTIVEEVWTSVGARRVIWRSTAEHDHLMTWVSHLPQLASTALALTLARANVAVEQGGPGIRDATRLAASSLLMWRPLLDANAPECIAALKRLEDAAGELRAALESGDQELLSEMWTTARGWRAAGDNRDAR